MSAPSDLSSELSPDPAATARAAPSVTRPLYWSVRRELWENRSIFIAPLAVAGVILFAFAAGAIIGHNTVPTVRAAKTIVQNGTVVTHAAVVLTPAQRAVLAAIPYDFAAVAMVVTLFLVAVFYCLGALHNERRDRSILFWKSLPVSDLTTGLSKAIVPLAILPPVAFVTAVGTQFLMLLINSAALAAHGKPPGEIWTQMPLGSMALVLAYGFAALTLWWAPVYAWLMLISGWARRAPFLWAVLPPLLLALIEKIALGANHVGSQILYRLLGGFERAFVVPTGAAVKAGTAFPSGLPQLDPGKFLSTPDLWIGLVVAGAFFAASVWLRRYREPV
jgi:ABC-2 type transport system permease protein